MNGVDPEIVSLVLKALKPSSLLKQAIDMVQDALPDDRDIVCVHHRNGIDWMKHCVTWEGIPDGVWRKNCLNEKGSTISMDIKKR